MYTYVGSTAIFSLRGILGNVDEEFHTSHEPTNEMAHELNKLYGSAQATHNT